MRTKRVQKVVVLNKYGKQGWALIDYEKFVRGKAFGDEDEVFSVLGYEGADFEKLMEKAKVEEGFIVEERTKRIWTVKLPEKKILKEFAESNGYKVISGQTLGKKINEILLRIRIKEYVSKGLSKEQIWFKMAISFYGNRERFEKLYSEVLNSSEFQVATT
jgi:hypothetical protein